MNYPFLKNQLYMKDTLETNLPEEAGKLEEAKTPQTIAENENMATAETTDAEGTTPAAPVKLTKATRETSRDSYRDVTIRNRGPKASLLQDPQS